MCHTVDLTFPTKLEKHVKTHAVKILLAQVEFPYWRSICVQAAKLERWFSFRDCFCTKAFLTLL